jgi:predicted ester cyclase
VFDKEKRQEKRERREAVKSDLEQKIKPRPTFAARQEQKERLARREAADAKREGAVADRLKALHAGTAGQDVAVLGSELLYLPVLSGLQLQINEQLSNHQKCFTRWTAYGRHDKEFLGMAPTNRDVQFGGTTITFLTDDEITQEIHYWDMVALLQQIQAP